MSQSISRYVKPLLSVLLALAVFVFWRYGYPQALAFQEQLQMFLFDGDYLLERLSEPGGVARYVAEFLVQFYNNPTFGALILALLLVLLQRLVWRLMRPAADVWYLLSFVPSMLFVWLMGDENVMLTALVALVMALVAMICAPRGKTASWMYLIIGIPVLYWAIGPVVIIVALYVAARGLKGLGSTVACLLAVLYVVAIVIVSARFLPYPLLRLSFGMSYYRYVEVVSYLYAAIALLCLVLAVFGHRLVVVGRTPVMVSCQVSLLVLIAAGTAVWAYDKRTYDLLQYDYLVRTNQWGRIIKKSQDRQPDLPMSVCATNLALAMNGQLGDRAFDFYQRGSGGLLPKFERNFATQQLTGEAYFQLGLINTAQRFAFEAMEAIPNYNKSVRTVKRLAETNLIDGQYDVAAKYLRMLHKTIFYRNWAKRTRLLLGDDEAIARHPLYGKLRQMRLDEDFLFSEQELDKICGQLFVHNPNNTMAMQYLLMYPLLDGDINKFVKYVQVVQEKVTYNPRACQEATAYAFMRQNQMPPQGLVGPMVVNQLQDFVGIYKSEGEQSPRLEAYKNTLWYYLTIQK